MKKIIFAFIISFSFNANIVCQERPDKVITTPKDYISQKNIVYTIVNGWKGRMDVYNNPKATKPTPLIINIHGGGWVNGRKETQGGFNFFFKNGFAVANVEYRLRDVAKAPAAIEDVRCALIYLHKHAKDLNIDTNRIVVMGSSAGGHLALMTGLLGNNNMFDSNCNYKPTIKVAAIINKYGAVDMETLTYKGSVKKWIDRKIDDKKFIQTISPLYHITKTSPPVFIIHGDKDPSIPYGQSELLYDKLNKNHIKTKFVTVKGGKHGKFTKEEKKNFYNELALFLKELQVIN